MIIIFHTTKTRQIGRRRSLLDCPIFPKKNLSSFFLNVQFFVNLCLTSRLPIFPSGTCFSHRRPAGIFQNDICNYLPWKKETHFSTQQNRKLLERKKERKKKFKSPEFPVLRNSLYMYCILFPFFLSCFFLKQVNITSQKTYQKEWKLLDHASMSVCSVSAYTIVFPLEMD